MLSYPVSLCLEPRRHLEDRAGRRLRLSAPVHLSSSQDGVALLEIWEEDPVGEASHADPDALQHTVAGELVHDEWRLHPARLLVVVGDDAADKVGLGAVERGHQSGQVCQEDPGHRLPASTFLLLSFLLLGWVGLTGVVTPQVDQQLGRAVLHDVHHCVVNWILVLLQPAGHVVRHSPGVVDDGKVGVFVSLGLRLCKGRKLAQGSFQFLLQCFVSCLGKERLFFNDCPDSHRFFKHDNAG